MHHLKSPRDDKCARDAEQLHFYTYTAKAAAAHAHLSRLPTRDVLAAPPLYLCHPTTRHVCMANYNTNWTPVRTTGKGEGRRGNTTQHSQVSTGVHILTLVPNVTLMFPSSYFF